MSNGLLASLTSADKVASANLTLILGDLGGAEVGIFLKPSGPIDESNAKAPIVLADLQGMRRSVKLAAGLNFLWWNWTNDAVAQVQFCREVFSDPARAPKAVVDSIAKAVAAVKPGRSPAVLRRQRAAARANAINWFAEKRCIRSFLNESERDEFDDFVDYGNIILASVSAEVGRQDYKFADTVALRYNTQIEKPTAVVGSAGVYFPNARVLAAASIRVENSFSEGAPRQYCLPTGTTPALQCRTLSLSAPASQNPVLLTGEIRWFATQFVGLNPRVTIDLTGDRGTGFELPILIRQATDKGFTSALIGGLRSKKSSPDVDDRAYVALEVGYTYGISLRQ